MTRELHSRGRALTRIRHAGEATPPNPPNERRAAARIVASNAVDAGECAELLAMLGLTAADGISEPTA